MVFGNMGDDLGHRRLRSPATRRPGENIFYGEYLMNAQGEDVVAGIRTPRCQQIAKLEKVMPACYEELVRHKNALEKHYADMQDIEFTIERGQALHAADALRQADRRPPR